jgi:hypothetical protein
MRNNMDIKSITKSCFEKFDFCQAEKFLLALDYGFWLYGKGSKNEIKDIILIINE